MAVQSAGGSKTRTTKTKKTSASLWNRLLSKRPVLFVLFFALVGVSLIVLTRAETVEFGTLPTGSNQIVVQYDLPMGHQLSQNDFNTAMPTAMLLYGDGKMLCGGMNHAGHSADMPATFMTKTLTKQQLQAVFDTVLNKGMQKLAGYAPTGASKDPTAFATTITLNSTKGAYSASTTPAQPNPGFAEVENYLKQQCAAATEAYSPDDVTVETVPAPSGSKATADLSDLTSALLPKELDLSSLGLSKIALPQVGQLAQQLKVRIPIGTANVYNLNNKLVKARLITNVPKYDAPQIISPSGKNKVSAQSTDRKVRWLYLIPSGSSLRGGEQAYIDELAKSIRDFYTRQTGKTISIETKIVYGKKTASQYLQCPDGKTCTVDLGGGPIQTNVVGAYYNTQDEFAENGISTNVVYQFATDSCIGLGGPVAPNADTEYYTFGYSGFSAATCNWYDGSHIVGAHETGHTFGLIHTCDSTLMSNCGGPSSWGSAQLNSGQAKFLAQRSPYFNVVPKNPIGYIDSCALENGKTVIYGWAHDNQAYAGDPPTVTINAGSSTTTVSTNQPNYRDSQINSFLLSRGDIPSSYYGFKAEFFDLYNDTTYTISGTAQNVAEGANTNLIVNNSSSIDGSGKAYFSGNTIPASCLSQRANLLGLGGLLGSGNTKPQTTQAPADPNANFSFNISYLGYSDAAYKNQVSMSGGTTKSINNTWSGAPANGLQPDWFMVSWAGHFVAPSSGTYTFYSEEDDGLILQLNKANIIDKWNTAGPTGQGTISLTAGQGVDIGVAMYDFTGSAKAVLYWSGPGINGKQLFPLLGTTTTPAAKCNLITTLLGCK